ncbi:hypothetical protein CMUS01_09169 [Colletotrichum musicola]|uniref:Uncharacterized protein n=1 Tax=Colletotrichum musicola TaxID=2175873 RepID=A0A8H6K979_9PEZI|nr:hypothetical protein CMUS01_09169 [Colletotrichum musicola]
MPREACLVPRKDRFQISLNSFAHEPPSLVTYAQPGSPDNPILDVDQSLFEASSAVETGTESCATPPGHLGLPPVPSHSLATRGSPAELSSYGVCRFASIPVGLGSSLTARMHTVLSSLSSRSSASRVLPPDAVRASPGRRECASPSPKTPRDDTLRYHVTTLNRAIATWGLC